MFCGCKRRYYVTMTLSSSDSFQLVFNARIWQSPGEDTTWMTFSTDSGYITAVGRHDPPVDKFPPNRRRDIKGRRIIPGLHESHLHLTYLGRQLNLVDLKGCQSVEQLQQQVRSFAAKRPGVTWIVGHGWEQHLLGRFPTRHDLDAACSDRPVHVSRICGHASVENSLALQLAGITLLPIGGHITDYTLHSSRLIAYYFSLCNLAVKLTLEWDRKFQLG